LTQTSRKLKTGYENKIINILSRQSLIWLFGLVGGVITGILGGLDVLTHAIVVLVIVDYLTGLGKAFQEAVWATEDAMIVEQGNA